MRLIVQLAWILASIVLGAVLLRFLFLLLGADPAHGFVEFIYSFSHAFIAPFTGLFGESSPLAGRHQIEIVSLVSIAVYTIVASLLIRFFRFSARW